jgi:hydroxyacid-oxoacid transhydrogenase
MGVALGVPTVVRHTAPMSPERHLEAAALLGADLRGAADSDAGELLARSVIRLMRAIAMPNGVAGVGYAAADLDALVEATLPQQRLLGNAPCELPRETIATLFERALRYW